MRRGSGVTGGARFVVLALVALAVSASLVAADGPWIAVDAPAEGQHLTQRQFLVNGTASATAHRVELGAAELGAHSGMNTLWVDGNLTMRPKAWFREDFSGMTNFDDRWVIERDTGVIEVVNGNLVMRSTWPRPGAQPVGLIRSIYDIFPSNVDWTAEVRAYFYYSDPYGSGIGITPGPISIAGSTAVAYYSNDGYYNRMKAYANGNEVYNEYGDYRYHVWTLDYTSIDQSATFLRDDGVLAHYDIARVPRNFWLGCLYTTTGNYSDISVDYVELWTYNGTWTSQPYDFGHDVRLEDARMRWTTTNPNEARIGMSVRTRTSSGDWSEWAPFVRGGAFTTSDVRYIQFQTGMYLRGVKSEQAAVMSNAFVVDYRDPVVSVEVREAAGEWATASGLERWSVELPLREDENTIEVRSTDSSGATNATSLRVVVDTTRPTGTLLISPKVSPSKDPEVTLALNASDRYGVPWVQLSNSPDMAGAVLVPFNATVGWSLDRTDGEVGVYARFVDSHGLLSDIVHDSLVLDISPPGGSVSIANDAMYSSTTTVHLDLEYYDNLGVARVELSNRADFWGAVEVAPPQKVVDGWELGGSDDGPRTVYLRVTDLVGNVVLADDTIEVHFPKALGAVVIQDGAAFTATTVVALDLEFPLTLHPSRAEVANDPAFATGQQVAFVPEMLWIIPGGDGPKTVYARFEDFRGIWSLPVSSTIVLDSTPPQVSVALEGGSPYTTRTNLSASVSCDDRSGPVRMWLSTENRFDLVDPVPFAETFAWTVAGNEADYHLWVQVEDLVGNLGSGSASIHFATRAPLLTLRLPDGPFTNGVTPLTVGVEVVDPYGGIDVQLALDADPGDDVVWQPHAQKMGVPVPPGTLDGAHAVRARARNAAGIVSTIAAINFTVDRVPPRLSIESPGDGEVVEQGAMRLSVEFTAEDPSGIYRVSYSVDDGNWTAAVSADRAIVVDLVGRGSHTVTIRITDRAGNEATDSTTFKLVKGEGTLAGGTGLLMLAIVAVAVVGAVTLLMLRARRARPGSPAPADPPTQPRAP